MGVDGIWINENYDTSFNGNLYKMNTTYQFVDTIKTNEFALEIIEDTDGLRSKWIAYERTGLKKRTLAGDPFNTVRPQGPNDASNVDINIRGGMLAVAHGGYNDIYKPLSNANGFSVYKNDEWTTYGSFGYPPFGDSVREHIYSFNRARQ